MKKILTISAIILITTALGVLTAGQYEITWSSIDTGAVTGTGGPYEITGTIGQHDTDISSAGEYNLNSGFDPANFGCVVNLNDLRIIAEAWLAHEMNLPADIDGDGVVDFEDFAKLAHSWYDTCPLDWPVK